MLGPQRVEKNVEGRHLKTSFFLRLFWRLDQVLNQRRSLSLVDSGSLTLRSASCLHLGRRWPTRWTPVGEAAELYVRVEHSHRCLVFFKAVSTEVIVEICGWSRVYLLWVLLWLFPALARASLCFGARLRGQELAADVAILWENHALIVNLLEDGGLQEFSADFCLRLRLLEPESLIEIQRLRLRFCHGRRWVWCWTTFLSLHQHRLLRRWSQLVSYLLVLLNRAL